MKFLCPNCNAKYRIGSEKLVGRQAAKIRCRKCDYRIQIAYRDGSDEFEVTASPTSMAPQPPQARVPKAAPPPGPVPRRGGPSGEATEGLAGRRPTGALPGLPGLGAPRAARGAATGLDTGARRAPLHAPPAGRGPVMAAAGSASAVAVAAPPPAPLPPPAPVPAPRAVAPAPAPVRPGAAGGTQLADQFRQSVQAGRPPVEEGPSDGWFVGVNGVPVGPIPVGDLRELAVAGHVDRRSLVWREGQAEWRPLGKFPHLARILDELGGASAGGPQVENPPAPAPTNGSGANGHAAVGFNGFCPPKEERPSAWGDLDDEDDEDEQPTTVKGRVSVPPPAPGVPSLMEAVVPPPPAPAAEVAPVTVGAVASPVEAPRVSTAMALSAPPPEGPASTISATPEPIVDEAEAKKLMRPKGRGNLYAWLAVAAAFALGAILMHVFGSSAPASSPKSTPIPEPARALAPPSEVKSERVEAAEAQPVSEPEMTQPDVPPEEDPSPGPSAVVPVTKPASSGIVPVPGPTASAAPKPTSSLLSGLGGPQTPGPSAGSRAGAETAGGGSGLDATAIQRTVRRYSPAVRQNCWQRALNARAPGVPSSAKVTALITVAPSGRVQSVQVSGAPRGYPGLAGCIESSVRGWAFPRAAGETVTNVPFMFVGQ